MGLQIYFQAVSSFLCSLRTILFILVLPLVVSWASYLTSLDCFFFIWIFGLPDLCGAFQLLTIFLIL